MLNCEETSAVDDTVKHDFVAKYSPTKPDLSLPTTSAEAARRYFMEIMNEALTPDIIQKLTPPKALVIDETLAGINQYLK